MAHPDMIADDDPYLERIRVLALALPGAREKRSVGHPAFYTSKVFAWVGMSAKVDDVWHRYPHSLSVLLPDDERAALLEDPRSYVPGYIGPSGWVGIHVGDDTDWTEVAELLEESFRQTAGKRLVAELDAR